MFPIVNPAGKVVGFGGRVLDQGMPKYLNSSETPLFHKGSTLYGLYQAKEGIRQADRVVVVEGYLDVIALAQHDIRLCRRHSRHGADRRTCARACRAIPKTLSRCSMATTPAAKRRRAVLRFSSKPACSGARRFCPRARIPIPLSAVDGKAALEAVLDQARAAGGFLFFLAGTASRQNSRRQKPNRRRSEPGAWRR